MHIVTIGWMFVVLLMAGAEATAPGGTVLGAFFTLVFYGVLPLAVLLYILATPARKRLRRLAEAQVADQARAAAPSPGVAGPAQDGSPSAAGGAGDGRPSGRSDVGQGNRSGQPAGAAVAPEREEP